jgi:hypothetical protein
MFLFILFFLLLWVVVVELTTPMSTVLSVGWMHRLGN